MNRFRTKKKAKDDFVAVPPPPMEPEISGPFKMFGRGKKSQDEPKRDLDLAAALPSSDDFRTSLLMTGLSARFSMLREQDDPNSKLGKASDDSVLFPGKRQSRMNFEMSRNLGDIAEVESIRAPPFARIDSYQSSDDNNSISGSMMNRAKPTEGNVLFGGRQKVYKISANGTSNKGRALYDDEFAMSAFQKWRANERDRGPGDYSAHDFFPSSLRPESPTQTDTNWRRETNSTTSSTPSIARNSTAATSITSSQPAPSLNDWQPPSATAPSPTPFQERSVTRTRRLYEQGLTQDLQDHQHSALTRIDTLSKQRGFGSRTPDLSPNPASPTNNNSFLDRSGDRRTILGKASAPNLRSFSPSTNVPSPFSPAGEPSPRLPALDQKLAYTASPPLSPPISESEEHTMMTIGANDRGKATAMGVFQRPAQQYDETKFAQRQQQLQQGRETPTNRFRTESNASDSMLRSASASSLHRVSQEKAVPNFAASEPTVHEDEVLSNMESSRQSAPQVTVARPDDLQHPAFRKSALPTPLTFSPSKTSDDLPARSAIPATEDSPTLGPVSGLSGMVRQHLRHDSNTSSIYGASHDEAEFDTQFSGSAAETNKALEHLSMNSNPWEPTEPDWAARQPREMSPARENATQYRESSASGRETTPSVDGGAEKSEENDEFARHLADGARRVRERLTTYVESDHSRSTSPAAGPRVELKEEASSHRANAFSALRPKSSKSSLGDRDHGQAKARKLLGLGLPTAQSPSQERYISDDQGPFRREQHAVGSRKTSDEHESAGEREEDVHAGLKAFRQARRELQRMKEMEVHQRRHQPQQPLHPQQNAPPPPPGRAPGSKTPSLDRGPPPVTYNRIPSEEFRNGGGSRAGSRGPSERDRSGSEASNGGRSGSRPPRLRNPSVPYDEQHHPQSPVSGHRQSPMMTRSPGFDHRRPMMPSYDAPPPPPIRTNFTNNGHLGPMAQSPSFSPNGSAPPLPPINPRRKNLPSPVMRRPHDESNPSSPHWSTTSDRGPNGHGPPVLSDGEEGPGQYRQRLRKVTSDANGLSTRGRNPHMNPPYGPPRPAGPPGTKSSGSMPGGMI